MLLSPQMTLINFIGIVRSTATNPLHLSRIPNKNKKKNKPENHGKISSQAELKKQRKAECASFYNVSGIKEKN